MGKIDTVQRRVFIAGDGKEFLDREIADAYEAKRAVLEVLEKHGVCRGGEWDQGMILDFMLENKDEILVALDPYYGEE